MTRNRVHLTTNWAELEWLSACPAVRAVQCIALCSLSLDVRDLLRWTLASLGFDEQPIDCTEHATSLSQADVGVAGGGADVGVAHELLQGANVDAVLEEMRRVRVAQRVAMNAFVNASETAGFLDETLEERGV